MTSQKSGRAKDKVSQESSDKGVTFSASSSWARKKTTGPAGPSYSPALSSAASRRGVSQTPPNPEAMAAPLSLRGLVAARRLTRELKNRTSLRSPSRPQGSHGQPLRLIQDQVPLWSARPEVKFPYARAEELIQAHLHSRLAGVVYHPAQCAHLATVLSAEIRELVKTVTPPRYKLVCCVSIGSKGQDDIVVSSQSLWDPHADSFAASHYVNPTLFCIALVHAIYVE
uniref:dynein light chain Tctex-type 5-like n=1 Tax=Jaculus jaculus TaxID=51337 RepID=UPI001E1B37FD|nr:dynein light chain Tctex-type 5-like [Jaculus jaculus]